MNKFKFVPQDGFRDASAFPNPTSEAETRSQMQDIPDQLKDYINNTILDGTDSDAHINTDNIPLATSTTPGLMPSADKVKVDGIEGGAEVNIIEDVADANGTTLISAITSKKAKLKPATNSQNGYMTSSDHTQMSSDHTKLSGITGVNVYYGICTSAYGSAEVKVVTTTTGDFTFEEGKILVVKFDIRNTYVGTISLNVDGSGAKEVRMQTLTDTIRDGMIVVFACNTLTYDALYMNPRIDEFMSDDSTNPVRNSTIKAYVDNAISGVSGGSNVWTATISAQSINYLTTITTDTGDFALAPGNKVILKCTYALGTQIISNAKLNVDGTGAKDVLSIDRRKFDGDIIVEQNGTIIFVYDGQNFIADKYMKATPDKYGIVLDNNGFGYEVLAPEEIDPDDPTWMVMLTSASGYNIGLYNTGYHVPYADVKIYEVTEENGEYTYTPFTQYSYVIKEPTVYEGGTDNDVDLIITFGAIPDGNLVICVHGNFTNFDTSYV